MAVGACGVNEEVVAHVDLGKRAVNGKLVAVLAQAAHHVVDVVAGRVLLAEHAHVVIGAVDGRAHEVGGAGVHADIFLVDMLLMDGLGDEGAEGRKHETAHLGEDGDVAHAGRHQDAVVGLMDALTDDGNVVAGLLGTIVHTHAARQVDVADVHLGSLRHAHRKLEELGGERRVIGVGHGVGGKERVNAEVLGTHGLQATEGLDHIGLAHAVLGVARVVHDVVAQLVDTAGVVAAEDGLGNLGHLLEEVHHGDVVEVDEGAELGRLVHVERGGLVGGEHDLVALEAASLGEQKLGVTGAVHTAALLVQDAQQRGVGSRLYGKVLLEPRVPGKGGVDGTGALANAGLVVEMERRGDVCSDFLDLCKGRKGLLFHGMPFMT